MKNGNVVVKKDCHSRKSLSGISTLDTKIVYRLGVSPTGAASKPWNVCCLAGKLSGSHPTYKEEALNKGSFRAPLRSGFTLIELLVVVLIIGILAAVAVPQYQKAVMKSRYALSKMHAETLWQAEQIYQLANGSYTGDIEKLDVSIESLQCSSNEQKTSSYCRFEGSSAGCDLYVSYVVCFPYSGEEYGLSYRAYYEKLAKYVGNQRMCVTSPRNADLSTLPNRVCASETGVSVNQVGDSNNRYWYYD